MGWYQRVLVDTGRAPAVWMLVAFLVTFAITRTITRRIRAQGEAAGQQGGRTGPTTAGAPHAGPAGKKRARRRGLGDVYIGGVHVHHQVWGILLLLASGLVEFRYAPREPWDAALAALFGMGAALTLDEVALWFSLDDVYWRESGRKSIDAIRVATAIGAALLLQAAPAGTATRYAAAEIGTYIFTVTLDLALSIICILKGKLATGVIGVIVPVLALVGALRLAKPSSPWARRRYKGARLGRSQHRFGPAYQRRHDRLRDLLGGRPTPAITPSSPSRWEAGSEPAGEEEVSRSNRDRERK